MKQNDYINGYIIGISDFQEQLLKLTPEDQRENITLIYKSITDLLIDRAKVSIKLNENENKRDI